MLFNILVINILYKSDLFQKLLVLFGTVTFIS